MKKLLVCTFCLFVALSAHAQQRNKNFLQRMADDFERQVAQAKQQHAPVVIAGDKRLITVTLEVQEHQDSGAVVHNRWECPAVIFTQEGAVAFDGECWEAVEKAAKLSVGPAVMFRVNFKKLGYYTTPGEDYDMPFYFESTYVVGDGEGEGGVRGTNEAFKRSADHSYIMYGLSLSNDPKNSEVKQAIAQYYRQNNLQPVDDETLSKYFKQKHPSFRAGTIRFP